MTIAPSNSERMVCGSAFFVGVLVIAVAVCLALLAGCASPPINEPIVRVEPETGYSIAKHVAQRPDHDPATLLVLAFSGGGTRAAALSYGVLEELRRTPIVVNGHHRRLLDEVDIITGVSGGSFTALAYALYGDRLFSEYEARFLKRNVQGELISRTLNPFKWPKFLNESYGRSELAADYYDEVLFEGATFDDLINKPTPIAMASATDLVTGDRFPFVQDQFDLICSDLSKVRLSRAAAATTAVPVVLSPVTFNNYGGHCGFEFPARLRELVAARRQRSEFSRALRRYDELVELQDSEARPYLHLVDGGVSDNVAMRPIIEALETVEVKSQFEAMPLLRDVQRIAVIVVNAVSLPASDWGKIKASPGIIDQLWQASNVPIDRYSYESIDLLNDIVTRWELERELAIAQAHLAGKQEVPAEINNRPVEFYAINVSFRELADVDERRYFENLPTSLVLTPEAVDRLRNVAGRMLRASPEYRRLIQTLGASSDEPPTGGSQ